MNKDARRQTDPRPSIIHPTVQTTIPYVHEGAQSVARQAVRVKIQKRHQRGLDERAEGLIKAWSPRPFELASTNGRIFRSVPDILCIPHISVTMNDCEEELAVHWWQPWGFTISITDG